jgi:peptidoglycan/xylan/chitin deacetylase (PgdA/CDA1 family)
VLTVSNYHYIRENYKTIYPSIFGVTPNQFKEQLLLLKNQGDFISANDLIKNTDAIINSKDNYILITFDDGLKEQYDYGFSILNSLNIPGLFFANSINYDQKKVSTVHKIHLLRSIISPDDFLKSILKIDATKINNINTFKANKIYIYDDEKSAVLKYILNFGLTFTEQEKIIDSLFSVYFNEAEVLSSLYFTDLNIIDLASKGFLGSHTHSHYPLGLLISKDIISELQDSKKYFEKLTSSIIDTVAYPYGTKESCTTEVSVIAKNVGYKLGFTTNRGANTGNKNNLLLNRYDCNDLVGGKNYSK